MMRIDSHQHFWKYDPASHVWMTGEMNVLKKDMGPDELYPLLEVCGIQGSIAVQASQSEDENSFLLALSEKYPFIRGIVGWTDLQAEDVAERLSCYSTKEKIKGFRHVIHDEADIDFMLRPAFLRGIRALQPFGFTYDMLIYSAHLPNALKLIRQFPDQPFIIDHIAKPAIKEHEIAHWKKLLTPVAALPNVYCKISGMVTEAAWRHWKQDDFMPYIDTVVNLFGTERILYGSDWPVCILSASYTEVYDIVKRYFQNFSTEDQQKFFGMNAKRFYRL